jgi:hypothetical protein
MLAAGSGFGTNQVANTSHDCLHLLLLLLLLQVIAYNKIDLPDSGDYWEFVREYLVVSEVDAGFPY